MLITTANLNHNPIPTNVMYTGLDIRTAVLKITAMPQRCVFCLFESVQWQTLLNRDGGKLFHTLAHKKKAPLMSC